MKSTSQGLSLLELMLTLVLLCLVSLGVQQLYRSNSALLVRSAVVDIARFIRTNYALTLLANRQTRVDVDLGNSTLVTSSGPALAAPNAGFESIRLNPPVRIAAASFGDLNSQLVQISLRPTGSATPGNLRVDTGESTLGCSLVLSLRGSVQTICD